MRCLWTNVLLCCICATSVFAQLKTTDKGNYVTAIVDPNNQGLITIRRAPGTNFDPVLSYPQKSFVYIMINGRIFTNNHTGTNIQSDSRFGGFLDNGVSKKTGDTIRTTWPDKSGCDIIQEVYPVTFEASGQIVMRWKIKNKSATDAFWGEAQFLFDIQVGAQNPNDGAPILTRQGYRPVWEKYKADSASGLSWFFASFENQLPNAPSFTPGTTGVGYNQDVNYKLGLKKPIRMTVGDWGSPVGSAALVDFLWGISPTAPWGATYQDAAIQYQWEGGWVLAGSTTEVASTSYGTGEFGMCYGQLYGIVFYPLHIKWKSTKYDPDTANIEFYAFDVYSPLPQDPNFGPPSEQTHLKLHVGPNLRIISPDTMLSPNQKIQLQQTAPGGLIPQYGVGTAMWKVVPEKVNKGNIASWLKFTAQSSLSGTGPIFFNSGDGDTCEHQVLIDGNVKDTNAPAISEIDSFFSIKYQKHFSAFENRPNDLLIKSVSWSPSSNFDVTVLPLHTQPCTEDSVMVQVAQLDSTLGGCVNFTITDCADNDTTIRVCFQARAPADLIAPVIQFDTATRPHLRVHVTDNAKYDIGIDSIWFEPRQLTDTSKFTISRTTAGGNCLKAIDYQITQLDTNIGGCFTVHALDCAGNLTTSKLYCFPTAPGSVGDEGGELIELIGNPAAERTTLRINVSAAYAATIRVVDLTGREVQTQQERLLSGRNDLVIGTSGLAEGIYYVIADWDGRSYAKKLTVIK